MAYPAQNTITLVVYYKSTQPISTLTLDAQDTYLAWLMDSLDVIPCGTYYCLRLMSTQEFRQARRIFPTIGHMNRHLRFRDFLRKKATKRITTTSAKISPTFETYALQPTLAARATTGSVFRLSWIKSIIQLTLNGL